MTVKIIIAEGGNYLFDFIDPVIIPENYRVVIKKNKLEETNPDI
jgi:hypothetical protein